MTITSTDRLLARTRRRLFATTLALLTALVVGVGVATAVVGLAALDADVDRALEAAVGAEVAALGGQLPASTAPDPQGSSDDGDGEERDDGENPPAVANTALLVLDPAGIVVQDVTGITIPGLPDLASVAAAGSGSDVRTVATSGGDVRVLTEAVASTDEDDEGAGVVGYVQGGFSLTLNQQQSRSLVLAIFAVGTVGLLAAAAITLVVTGRALVPIRQGFEDQRRFVADASHELRTPAALIRANAEVLEREGLVADDGRDLLADVIAEADRLGGLVGDLLQIAAWDETRLVLARAPLDVAEVARDTVRGAAALADERGVRLTLDAPGPAPAVADRARIVQLLLVLVDNAMDHSPVGGEVAVRARHDGRTVTVDVDDQGPGIPEADRRRIFEPFTRLPGTTRRDSGGTGLGLAIARRIAEAHGGSIEAGALPAGGARFTVTLPAETGG